VTDAGTADSATAIGRATVRGLIVDYDTKHPLAGLTVTEGDATTTTDAHGLWSLSVVTGIPMYPVISGNPKYVKLNLPENIVTGDFDHGRVLLPTLTTFHLGTSALPGYDATRGIIYVTAAPPDPNTAQSIAYNMMASFGFSPTTYFGCLLDLWNRESGWVYDAENPSGAYGIPQALPGSKMASAGADWQTNPATQIRWGLGYIKAIYGTPCGAWSFELANGYY